MMKLSDHMSDVTREMALRSRQIRRDFAQHAPSAGENREDIVQKFLASHLPKRFGMSTGFMISHNGELSRQADLMIVDHLNNSALLPDTPNQMWPVESVYALIDVKTNLGLNDLQDAIAKGQRFKKLAREFCATNTPMKITDSLFVIWAFESPGSETMKKNLLEILTDLPSYERPDLIMVLNKLVVRSGSYLEISTLGQPNSPHRRKLQAQHPNGLQFLLPELVEVYDFGENALLAWYVWFDSWLRQVGPRFCDPVVYLPPNKLLGRKVRNV